MDLNFAEVVEAVHSSTDPCTSNENRLKSYTFIERIRANPLMMIKCGRQMCKLPYPVNVRHFALQMLEETVKYHWYFISVEQKILVKDTAMELIDNGTLPILEENVHIKDKVSRLVVEMMKKEWPKHWQHLLEDLNGLSDSGNRQTEIVVLVLLRISEDVASLKNFKESRRQEIQKALNNVMGSIFSFLFKLLEFHYAKYKQFPEGNERHQEHGKVAKITLMAITSYVEWGLVNYVFAQDKFFPAVRTLIVDPYLSLQVTECLLQIVLRRDKVYKMIPAQILFHNNVLQPILNAAEIFSKPPIIDSNYRIMKGLAHVLSNIGIQLTTVWGKERFVKEPPGFDLYIKALMSFTIHPSIVIYSYTKDAWRALFKNEKSSTTEAFLENIPLWMKTMFSKLVKSGYPSHKKDEASQYSILDFDSDVEFQNFFNWIKIDAVESLRFAILLRPEVYFELLQNRIEEIIVKSAPTEEPSNDEELEFGSVLANEWAALANICESPLQSIFQSENYEVPVAEGIKLLEAVCNYQSSDPVITLSVLHVLSGLCCFLSEAPHMVEPIITKLFDAITCNVEYENKSSPMQGFLKNLQRDACLLLQKILKKYHKEISPHYESISLSISQIISNEYSKTSMGNVERMLLEQTRIFLTKNLNDLGAVDTMLEKSLAPVKQRWIELRPALSTSEALIDHIGVTNEEPALQDAFDANRRFITLCLGLMVAATKGVEAYGKKGSSPEFSDGCCRILHKHISPMLATAYSYCRSYHGIWSDEMESVLKQYNEAFQISPAEMDNLLGVPVPLQSNTKELPTNLSKIRKFLFSTHDTVCVLLGIVGSHCGKYFYEMPNIAEYAILAPLYNLKNVPYNRVSHILRIFIKNFCTSCPQDMQESLLLPVLNHLCPIMSDILVNGWQYLKDMDEKDEEEEEDDTDLYKDMFIRSTARDYIEFLRVLLVTCPREQTADAQDVDMEESMCTEENKEGNVTAEKLSSIGRIILSIDSISHPVLSTLLLCLTSPDTMCMRKAVNLSMFCIEALIEDYQKYISDESITYFITAVLKSINMHGHFESDKMALLEMGTKLYALLRPKYNISRVVLDSICKSRMIGKLDQLLFETEKNMTRSLIKGRRDCFCKVIALIVEKDGKGKYKKRVDMMELPSTFFSKEREQPALRDISMESSLSELFNSKET